MVHGALQRWANMTRVKLDIYPNEMPLVSTAIDWTYFR
jgi:hypothetical protein